MTSAELIAYYANLLIIQYGAKPKARAQVELVIGELIGDQIAGKVKDAFDLETAVGKQLTALGTYRGVERVYYGFAPGDYFTTPDYDETDPYSALGFMLYESPSTCTWLCFTYELAAQPIFELTDAQMRQLIKLRAKVQSSPSGLGYVDDILFEFFGDTVILFDNGNMTMTYLQLNSDATSFFSLAAISKSLPRPAGVQATAARADLLTDFFGFQDYGTDIDPAFVGFSDYSDIIVGTFIFYP